MLSTETTTSESLPGFSRRAIVKALTNGQLASLKSVSQGFEEEEMNAFYQEIQRKSPDMFYDSSVSAAGNNAAAVAAARTLSVNDNGWSPSRPRRHPPRPRRERSNNNARRNHLLRWFTYGMLFHCSTGFFIEFCDFWGIFHQVLWICVDFPGCFIKFWEFLGILQGFFIVLWIF